MESRSKVSVIIPVYNTAPYLEVAVRSILDQILEEIEIIAINDGSTDNSLEILQQLQAEDSRLQVYSQPNQGLSITRNVGLEKATGEFIYFFDSDDFLEKEALADCYNKATKDKCDFVAFDADILNNLQTSNQNLSAYHRKHVLNCNQCYKGYEAWELLGKQNKNSPAVWLNFIRTDYLRSINLQFYPGILYEDRLFTFILYLRAERVSYISQNYFHRRVRENSIMTTPMSLRNINHLFTICKELAHYLHTHTMLSAKRQELIRIEISRTVNTIASLSMPLTFGERMIVLRKLLTNYAGKLSIASIILLFFPCLKLKK